MAELQRVSDLMSEKEVYEKFPNIFADKELREARQAGQIEYYNLRKGPHYSEDQLIGYLETRRKKPCQNRPLVLEASDNKADSGSSVTNGSDKRRVRLITTDIGTNPATTQTESEDELIARALERTT